jgi:cell division protein FtsQ
MQRKRELRALVMRLLTVAVLALISAALIYMYNYLTTTKRLSVKHIRISGVTRTSPKDVERLLVDLKTQNILQAQLQDYEKRLRKLPRVKDADLKRIFPSSILCSITERKPVALVFANRFLEIDEEGMILTKDEITSKLDLPIITGIPNEHLQEGTICKDKHLQEALEALRICKELGGNFVEDISEIKAEGIRIVSIKDGSVIVLGNSDFEKRLRKYFLLRETIERNETSTRIIDLRFDDQIVLRSAF